MSSTNAVGEYVSVRVRGSVRVAHGANVGERASEPG